MLLVPNLVPNKVCVFIAGMSPKISLALALFGLSWPLSDFATVLSVPPAAGGQGIQAALDSLSSGGEVDLSAGQYLIREPVILRNDHRTLRGCGLATVLQLADGANCPVEVLGSPQGGQSVAYGLQQLGRIQVHGLASAELTMARMAALNGAGSFFQAVTT
jgi:hypothetical protein